MRRPAALADLPSVHAIFNDPAVAPMLGRRVLTLPCFAPIYADLCARPTFYVYVEQGAILACCHLSPRGGFSAGASYLSTLAVAPSAQGVGLGRQIVTELIAESTALGASRLEAIVQSNNLRALRLYESLGFKIVQTFAGTGMSDHYLALPLC